MIFPSILSYASVVGKKEGEGPLAAYFDQISTDTHFGQTTWEKAESQMQTLALQEALKKASLSPSSVHMLFAGDLLNQCIGTGFAARGHRHSLLRAVRRLLHHGGEPFSGRHGCWTEASPSCAAAMTSSHFCLRRAAVPSSPWNTAASAPPPHSGPSPVPALFWWAPIRRRPIFADLPPEKSWISEITDANNMGAAMAPAFVDTVLGHFQDTGLSPNDYDLIVSGDLGKVGKELARDLFRREGLSLGDKLDDCGTMIFDLERQDVHAGGSGCGCSAVVLCGYLMEKLKTRKLRNILFCGTGALLSPVSTQQGESIPSVCHAVAISMESGCM